MAIMRTCCCCGIRGGSIACAVYSIIIALLGIANYAVSLVWLPGFKDGLQEIRTETDILLVDTSIDDPVLGDLNIDALIFALKVDYVLALLVLTMVLLTSIFVIIGVSQDSKQMLVPFIVAKSVGFVWYMYAIAVGLYCVISIGNPVAEFGLMFELIILFPFLITDIVCVLCVLSQYQEYRDGRGRATDVNMTGTTTTRQVVVIQQQHAPAGTGSFAYRPMQDDSPPPPYANPTGKAFPSVI